VRIETRGKGLNDVTQKVARVVTASGVRTGLFGASAALLLGLLGWAIAGLPGFGNYPGPYGDVMNRVSVPERNANNVVTAVTLSLVLMVFPLLVAERRLAQREK